ncbi:MAG: Gx transporter family protein [Desulfuromonadales bacterium]|nr:Gx transporter family protein [Desulfuromonadales bacterium]
MTCSAAETQTLERLRRRIFLALFTALAVALHTLEALFPSPLPWFRPGLANILTVLALFLYGGGAAWSVTLARIAIGSLLLGQLFSPGFFLALAGGVTATAVMTGAEAVAGRRLGPVGISALGAAGHVVGQLLMAWLVVVRHPGVWRLLPLLLLFSLLAGLINGLVADSLLRRLRQHPAMKNSRKPGQEPEATG